MDNPGVAAEMIGYTVVAHAEGRRMGRVDHVYVDAEDHRVSGVTLKPRKVLGWRSWVPAEQIELIGKDVILVDNERSITDLKDDRFPIGRSLKDMRGLPVVTTEGKQLGELDDVEVHGERWSISELRLADGTRLPIDGRRVELGPDSIIVPADYVQRLEKGDGSPGLLARAFGERSPEAS